MTTDELKAAAERLRRWDAGEASDKVYPHAVYSTACANDDAWSLAREFAGRLAADEQQAEEDADPISSELNVEPVISYATWRFGTAEVVRDSIRKLLEALKGGA